MWQAQGRLGLWNAERVLGKAGHSGCCEANLTSIKASFRAAKPFPYVGL